MADAADSKSAGVHPHVGSSPTSGTRQTSSIAAIRKITIMRRLSTLLVVVLTFTASAAPGFRERGEPGPDRRVVLSPTHALSDDDRAELARQGVLVGRAVGGGRYIARLKPNAVTTDARIVAVDTIDPADKIHASAYRDFARGRTMARVNVIFHEDVDFDAARQAIIAAGGVLDPFKLKFSPSQRVEATVASSTLQALAADDDVLGITAVRNFRLGTDNSTSAQIANVTPLYDAPYGLTGAGVTVSLFELAAAQGDHVEFGGRLSVVGSGGGSGDKNHATHVAGTIGAGGVRPEAKGMAPAVQIHQFCVQTPCGGSMSFLDDKEEKLPTLGVAVDNNSWGFKLGWDTDSGDNVWLGAGQYYGAYDLILTSPLDEISNDHDILFVHSSGNDADAPNFSDEFFGHRHTNDEGDTDFTKRYCYSLDGSGSDCPATCNGGCEKTRHLTSLPFGTVGVTAAAKNVITVGAVNQNLDIVGFSSRGPAKDGRVKPDLVARGNSVLSSVPTNSYSRLSGTSMAAPAVTGVAALLTEQWKKTFGTAPKPLHLKAVLIAGATDLGNPGPDFTHGFGLVNAKASVDTIIADAAKGNRIRTITLAAGTSATHEFPIAVSTPQNVRVVLQWNDPAIPFTPVPDDIAPVALVNDLDLRVIGPDGTVHLPWVLDSSQVTANATRGVNTKDNTEVVEIANAPVGTYRIVVAGTSVAQGPQTAVVVTSAPAAAPCIDLQEPNDDAATAFGNLVGGASVSGAICTAGDVDYFRFTATKTGPVSVTVTAGDTPLRVTLTGTGISRTQDIPATSTAVLNADANVVPNPILVRIEAIGQPGVAPTYLMTPQFGLDAGARRRSARH